MLLIITYLKSRLVELHGILLHPLIIVHPVILCWLLLIPLILLLKLIIVVVPLVLHRLLPPGGPVLLLIPVQYDVVGIRSTPSTIWVRVIVFGCLCPVLGTQQPMLAMWRIVRIW